MTNPIIEEIIDGFEKRFSRKDGQTNEIKPKWFFPEHTSVVDVSDFLRSALTRVLAERDRKLVEAIRAIPWNYPERESDEYDRGMEHAFNVAIDIIKAHD